MNHQITLKYGSIELFLSKIKINIFIVGSQKSNRNMVVATKEDNEAPGLKGRHQEPLLFCAKMKGK